MSEKPLPKELDIRPEIVEIGERMRKIHKRREELRVQGVTYGQQAHEMIAVMRAINEDLTDSNSGDDE